MKVKYQSHIFNYHSAHWLWVNNEMVSQTFLTSLGLCLFNFH